MVLLFSLGAASTGFFIFELTGVNSPSSLIETGLIYLFVLLPIVWAYLAAREHTKTLEMNYRNYFFISSIWLTIVIGTLLYFSASFIKSHKAGGIEFLAVPLTQSIVVITLWIIGNHAIRHKRIT